MKDNNYSSALGAKTARACDSCLRIRARWFCAADDAFLCHGCDNLVHSANQLACRHERVRLQSASSSSTQAWHSGFTRKARTPRGHSNKNFLLLQQEQAKDEGGEEQEGIFFSNNKSSLLPLVPEIGNEEFFLDDETEENMLCRVPVFDPFDSELCSVYNEVKDEILLETNNIKMKNDVVDVDVDDDEEEEAFDLEKFSELLPSDLDLAEFAADVESLLELDEDNSVDHVKESDNKMVPCKEEEEEEDDGTDAILGAKCSVVKVKDEELLYGDDDDMACHNLESILDWNMIDSSESMVVAAAKEEEGKVNYAVVGSGSDSSKKERLLRLNYEDVIAAWATQGSPWTTGTPPNFNTHNSWPHYLVSGGSDVECSSYGEVRSLREGREARVSRYREKRRTRLFAKKIRYEVRKLNAEKRPRMKGRFVKRSSFVGDTAFPPQLPLTSN